MSHSTLFDTLNPTPYTAILAPEVVLLHAFGCQNVLTSRRITSIICTNSLAPTANPQWPPNVCQNESLWCDGQLKPDTDLGTLSSSAIISLWRYISQPVMTVLQIIKTVDIIDNISNTRTSGFITTIMTPPDFRLRKNLFVRVLSKQLPFRLMLPVTPSSRWQDGS